MFFLSDKTEKYCAVSRMSCLRFLMNAERFGEMKSKVKNMDVVEHRGNIVFEQGVKKVKPAE